MNNSKILIIPDTNFFHMRYNKKANYDEFAFSSSFLELYDVIESNELIDLFSVGISKVVLEELLSHKVDAHRKYLNEVIKIKNNFRFHKVSIKTSSMEREDYLIYLKEKQEVSINELFKRSVNTIVLPIPSKTRFDSLVERAFKKKPPFSGKKGQSDSGFKDALFWESILEYKKFYDYTDVYICTDDKDFHDNFEIFKKEFEHEYKNTKLAFVKKNDLLEKIKTAALSSDFLYHDPEIFVNIENFLINNSDFLLELSEKGFIDFLQMKQINFGLFEVTNYKQEKDFICLTINITFLQELNDDIVLESDELKFELLLKISDGDLFFMEIKNKPTLLE